jgi:hypothetical protein
MVRARDAVRAARSNARLTPPYSVLLLDGIHPLTEPVVLAPEDSGTADDPVTYKAAPGARPIVSGGRRISGWRPAGPGLWEVTLPEVQQGRWRFRQLYVNGQKRRRARIPNQGFLRVAGFPDGGKEVHYHTDCQRFEFAPGDLNPDWTNLTDVEVIVYHFWTDSHLPIQSIDPETNIVTFQHKAGKVFTDDFTSDGARYIVENVYEGLDEPGEWYLHRKTGVLSYRPLPGEDMASVEVTAPMAPALLRFQGDALSGHTVAHIRFQDLTFEYTHFDLPPGNSNDRQGSASVTAAIQLTGTRHCEISRCRIRNLGNFAVEIAAGCRYNRFAYNDFRSLGAGGFRVNGGHAQDPPRLRTGWNILAHNTVDHFGQEFPSAVGVLLQHTEGNRVEHNHIHHGGYTGISIGWNWGYQRSVSRDNIVACNHIHDIGQGLLSDMGAIYTLGPAPGTVIRNNLIHDVEANHYGGWGIYNDEGSAHLLIEKNVVYNTKFAGYNIHFCKEVTVRNNIFALGRLQQLSRSRQEPHKSVFFENNIVYWKEGVLLDKNWRDRPYTFYFHPKNDSGTREVTSTFDMDWNLYYNPAKELSEVAFNGLSFDDWQAAGKDRHSLYVDPKFVDPENHDFRLQPDSPAFTLGFQPIDLDAVGPQGDVGPVH